MPALLGHKELKACKILIGGYFVPFAGSLWHKDRSLGKVLLGAAFMHVTDLLSALA